MWGRDCSGSVAIPTFAMLPHQSREAVSLHQLPHLSLPLGAFSNPWIKTPLLPPLLRSLGGVWQGLLQDIFIFEFVAERNAMYRHGFWMSFVEYAENSDVFHCLPSASGMFLVLPDTQEESELFQLTRAHQTNAYFRFMLVLLCNEQLPVLSLLPSVPAFSLLSLAVVFRYHWLGEFND